MLDLACLLDVTERRSRQQFRIVQVELGAIPNKSVGYPSSTCAGSLCAHRSRRGKLQGFFYHSQKIGWATRPLEDVIRSTVAFRVGTLPVIVPGGLHGSV